MSHKRKLGQTLCFASLRLLLLLATVRIDTRSAIKYATIILLRSACCSDCCCCCLQEERGEEGDGIPTKCGHFNNEKHQLFMHSTPTVVVVVLVVVRCLVSILLVRCFVVVLFYDSHCCSSAVSTLLPLCFTPCTPCPSCCCC